MKSLRFLLAAGFVVVSLCYSLAADWPQWRGPERSGISKETGLLKEWPKDGPKLLWQRTDIGRGYSTPSVVEGRLYLQVDKEKEEFAVALEAADGKPVWSVGIGKVGINTGPQYPGTRGTPTVDGDAIYCLSSDGDLVCLERASGKRVWKKNLKTDFEGKPGMWAYSESPLIDGDALIVTPGGAKATLVSLNKKTGEVNWKAEAPGGEQAAYASPIAVEIGGVRQYVQFLQKGVVGVNAKTGKFLWRYDQTAKNSPANIPTPVFQKDLIYTGTGRGGGGSFRVKAKDAAFQVEPLYFDKNLPNCIGGTVILGDYLYGTIVGGLECVELATGKVKWKDKCIGPASICYAEGNLYLHGEKGDVALVEATSEGYHEKGRFTPPNQPKRGSSQAWCYPVVANGKLYIRDLESLWCYDIAAK